MRVAPPGGYGRASAPQARLGTDVKMDTPRVGHGVARPAPRTGRCLGSLRSSPEGQVGVLPEG